MFSRPVGIDIDRLSGVLYVADQGNKDIRRVTLQGLVTTMKTPKFANFAVSLINDELWQQLKRFGNSLRQSSSTPDHEKRAEISLSWHAWFELLVTDVPVSTSFPK